MENSQLLFLPLLCLPHHPLFLMEKIFPLYEDEHPPCPQTAFPSHSPQAGWGLQAQPWYASSSWEARILLWVQGKTPEAGDETSSSKLPQTWPTGWTQKVPAPRETEAKCSSGGVTKATWAPFFLCWWKHQNPLAWRRGKHRPCHTDRFLLVYSS